MSCITNIFYKIGTVMNLQGISGVPFNSELGKPYKTDLEALESDWNAIGEDFRSVMYGDDDKMS